VGVGAEQRPLRRSGACATSLILLPPTIQAETIRQQQSTKLQQSITKVTPNPNPNPSPNPNPNPIPNPKPNPNPQLQP